jgi:type IV secretory pathway VirJ component
VPETTRIDPHLLQCFYGADDDTAACRQLKAPEVEIIRTTGGHHFDGDYAALARRILLGARQRSAPLREADR